MSYSLFVVTKVPDLKDVQSYKMEENPGNMASPMTEPIFVVNEFSNYIRLNITELMCLQVENFKVGEILVLDSDDRDQFGRKPSKWSIEIEYIGELFDDHDVLKALLDARKH